MNTWAKVGVAAVVGLLVMWLCYQVFHLEQVATTVVAIVATAATVAACDKLAGKK